MLGAALLFTQSSWAGGLTSLTSVQRLMLLVMGPLTLSLAIWDAGRDRRRGLTELLHTASLPVWRRTLLRVSTLAAAVIAAHLLVAGLAAAFVTQQTTYLGGRWWLILLIAAAGYLPFVAVGWLIGSLLPGRVVAPLAGVGAYLALGALTSSPSAWVNLTPPGRDSVVRGSEPTVLLTAVAVSLFLLVALTAMLFALPVRRRVGAVPLLLATAVVLLTHDRAETSWWQPDAEARALVCSEGDPRICVWRVHDQFLEQTVAAVQPALDRLGDGAPQAVHEVGPDQPLDPGVAGISLTFQIPLVGDALIAPEQMSNDLRRGGPGDAHTMSGTGQD